MSAAFGVISMAFAMSSLGTAYWAGKEEDPVILIISAVFLGIAAGLILNA